MDFVEEEVDLPETSRYPRRGAFCDWVDRTNGPFASPCLRGPLWGLRFGQAIRGPLEEQVPVQERQPQADEGGPPLQAGPGFI